MEDVLEIYERPYDAREPVVWQNEKPVTPCMPISGRDLRPRREGRRGATANMSVDERLVRLMFSARWSLRQAATSLLPRLTDPPLSSQGSPVRWRCSGRTPDDHLVMDNLNTHHRKSLTDPFGEVT